MTYSKNTLKGWLLTTLFLLTSFAYAGQIHPNYSNRVDLSDEPALKTVTSASYDGKTLELNDGSLWTISSYESRSEVSQWLQSDPVIFLKEQWPWYNGGSYKIINLITAQTVCADLSQTGYTNDPNGYTIFAISSQNTLLLKTAKSRLVVFETKNIRQQQQIVDHWKIGDTILIGKVSAEKENSNTKPTHILINLKKNQPRDKSVDARYLGYIQT